MHNCIICMLLHLIGDRIFALLLKQFGKNVNDYFSFSDRTSQQLLFSCYMIPLIWPKHIIYIKGNYNKAFGLYRACSRIGWTCDVLSAQVLNRPVYSVRWYCIYAIAFMLLHLCYCIYVIAFMLLHYAIAFILLHLCYWIYAIAFMLLHLCYCIYVIAFMLLLLFCRSFCCRMDKCIYLVFMKAYLFNCNIYCQYCYNFHVIIAIYILIKKYNFSNRCYCFLCFSI